MIRGSVRALALKSLRRLLFLRHCGDRSRWPRDDAAGAIPRLADALLFLLCTPHLGARDERPPELGREASALTECRCSDGYHSRRAPPSDSDSIALPSPFLGSEAQLGARLSRRPRCRRTVTDAATDRPSEPFSADPPGLGGQQAAAGAVQRRQRWAWRSASHIGREGRRAHDRGGARLRRAHRGAAQGDAAHHAALRSEAERQARGRQLPRAGGGWRHPGARFALHATGSAAKWAESGRSSSPG